MQQASSWVPPPIGAQVEVEVEPETGHAWRRADVREQEASGRFCVCVHDADGKPDEDWFEWYSRADEGIEWRWLESDADSSNDGEHSPSAWGAGASSTSATGESPTHGAGHARKRQRKTWVEWTADEEQRLCAIVESGEWAQGAPGTQEPHKWKLIAAMLDGRHTPAACQNKHAKLLNVGAPSARTTTAPVAAEASGPAPAFSTPQRAPPRFAMIPAVGVGLEGMAAVRAALGSCGLVQYADTFEEQGFDDLEFRAIGLGSNPFTPFTPPPFAHRWQRPRRLGRDLTLRSLARQCARSAARRSSHTPCGTQG